MIIRLMMVATLMLSGCSVTIFRGNWRYNAEVSARAGISAERVQPPQSLSPQVDINER